MDFWNRLIGGSGSSNTSKANKSPTPVTPHQRLAKFKRAWQTLLHSWRNTRENDYTSQDMLRSHIKRLVDMLLEEEKTSTRLCINFCYEQQVFIAVSKIGQNGSNGVMKECISVFSTLIDNEDEDFLGNQGFAHSLISFLESTSTRSVPAFECEFVELLFSISAKIRLNPHILQAWFTKENGQTRSGFDSLGPQQKFAGITNKEDFPLFYLLIDYVHHEGRVGDFARTGLLYIIEATSSSCELEKWIVESDLATLMASGLGALYSQLSRKLVVTFPTDEPPAILVLSDFKPTPPVLGAETSTSSDFKTHLETFLSYLIFWQDVLDHCRSSEVKQTLLDHFQILFLQQLLYPSLLESSDVDGGSSVAVLTYVRVLLDTLEHADMIHLVLSYLMNLRVNPVVESHSPMSISNVKRRQSLDLLSQINSAASDIENPTPEIYSLVDLIMTSLGSKSQQTVSATLRLVSTILRKHYPYAMNTLLKISPVPVGAPTRTIGAHNQELDLLFTMVTDLSDDRNATRSYEDHLKDCQVMLESHPCSGSILDPRKASDSSHPNQDQLGRMQMHTMYPHDPLLRNIVDILATFFSNTVETNLVLTCVIVDLAGCAWMRPEGWLYFDPEFYEFDKVDSSDQDDIDDMDHAVIELDAILDHNEIDNSYVFGGKDSQRLKEINRARRRPRLIRPPPIIEVLQDLVKQVQIYRQEIPDFNFKLAERRRAFEVTDDLNDALLSGHTSTQAPSQFTSHQIKITSLGLDPFTSRSLVRLTASENAQTRSQNVLNCSGYSTPTRTSRLPNRNIITSASPLRGLSPSASSPSSLFGSHLHDTLQRRIKVLQPGQKGLHLPPPPEEDAQSIASTPTLSDSGSTNVEFSFSHLLTNVMILQEFILELAALTQVRSALFGDVKCA